MSGTSRSENGYASSQALDPEGWTPVSLQTQAWPPPRDETMLERVLRVIRRRGWLILIGMVVGAAVAVAITLAQPKTYRASASVLVHTPSAAGLTGTSGTPNDANRDSATNVQLMSLPAVADRAAANLGGGLTPAQIRSTVSIRSGGAGDVTTVTANSSSGALAARVANAYAQAYIGLRQRLEQAAIAQAIARVTSDLNAAGAGARAASASAQLESLRVAQSLASGDAQVVQRATIPASASAPATLRNGLIGLGGGALLGFVLAYLLERTDRRLKSIEELEDVYRLPILARIPRSRALGKRVRQNPVHVISEALSRTQEAEAFRTLRANLRYFNVDRKIKSILVASPMPGEGKSTTATFLAISMAAMGDRVVLVEADLRKSGAETPLSNFGGDGLSLVLAGFDLDDALTEVPVSLDTVSEEPRTLTLLAHGPLPPNPAELLESDRMRWVIQELERRFDTVIIDSPALSTVSDALVLVPQVSGVLVVSRLRQTTRHAALNLAKQIRLLGGRPLGAAANSASLQADDYYYKGVYAAHR